MTAWPAATPVEAGTELLERAVSYTRASLSVVTADDLERSTPCREWRLVELLRHMDDSLQALHEAGATGQVRLLPDLDPAVGAPGLSVVESLRRRACALLGAWSLRHAEEQVVVSGRVLPASLVALTGALEIAVHGWDVARACGVDRPLPDELARALLAVAPSLISAEDRGQRFAPAVPAAAGASASSRLLAHTGRQTAR